MPNELTGAYQRYCLKMLRPWNCSQALPSTHQLRQDRPPLLLACLSMLARCDRKEHNSTAAGAPLAATEVAKFQACTADTDSVYVQNGCCDCMNGGADLAINKAHVTTFRARFQCKDVPCTMMAAIPECGSGQVSCITGACSYAPSAPR